MAVIELTNPDLEASDGRAIKSRRPKTCRTRSRWIAPSALSPAPFVFPRLRVTTWRGNSPPVPGQSGIGQTRDANAGEGQPAARGRRAPLQAARGRAPPRAG